VNDPTALSLATSALAILAGYLAGSIPFGYLIAYWVKGIDIRTVGSGNVGATNVGRTLGFRYFLIVLTLDLLKGFLPTIGFPWMLTRLTGSHVWSLPVLIALAAILGHTFPVYLKFRGGKGVATSLGCVLALDAVSCGVAVVTFLILLVITRYVSLSSLVGGFAFVAAHFLRQSSPFNRENIAMSLFSIAVLLLLLFLHRGNLARIWAGTERRVNFRRPRNSAEGPPQSRGKIAVFALAGLLVLTTCLFAGIRIYQHANQSIETTAGPWQLRETSRVATGQQRVDRVVFAAAGTRLAATCPRYDRVIVYQVDGDGKLTTIREIQLDGRPVALANLGDRFVVLERPSGDQRHVEPGWWETFDLDGNRAGGRHLAGFYPDDLAVSPDGRHLLLLSSGQAEGDPKKPMPALEVVAPNFEAGTSRLVGRLAFDATDDPARLALSESGRAAAVLLAKSNQTVAIDLSAPESPRLIGRLKPSGADVPYLSCSDLADRIVMPVASQSEAIIIEPPAGWKRAALGDASAPAQSAQYLACARHHESVLELFEATLLRSLGRLPLTGPLNLGRTRPTGLAYSSDRGLLAVATRSGSIHMIKVEWRFKPQEPQASRVATRSDGFTRH
jgi:acyl-phosphate glycerol 3-phosphate acyltransferase